MKIRFILSRTGTEFLADRQLKNTGLNQVCGLNQIQSQSRKQAAHFTSFCTTHRSTLLSSRILTAAVPWATRSCSPICFHPHACFGNTGNPQAKRPSWLSHFTWQGFSSNPDLIFLRLSLGQPPLLENEFLAAGTVSIWWPQWLVRVVEYSFRIFRSMNHIKMAPTAHQ